MAKKSTTTQQQKVSHKQKKIVEVDTIEQELDKTVSKLSKLLRKVSATAAISGAIPDIDDDDLLCMYNITITDKDGNTVIKNEGATTLSGISDAAALPEAPQLLETVFRAIIWRPIRNKFMVWLNTKIESNRALPELPGAMSEDDDVIIPQGTSLSD